MTWLNTVGIVKVKTKFKMVNKNRQTSFFPHQTAPFTSDESFVERTLHLFEWTRLDVMCRYFLTVSSNLPRLSVNLLFGLHSHKYPCLSTCSWVSSIYCLSLERLLHSLSWLWWLSSRLSAASDQCRHVMAICCHLAESVTVHQLVADTMMAKPRSFNYPFYGLH